MKPLYICNPEINTTCKKTSCQKECYFTSNPKFKTEYSPEIRTQFECDRLEKTIKEKIMGIINADELAKSYKISLLKKIKAGDLHDDDLFQISSIRTNPKYFNTNAIELEEFTKYIALKIGEHTGVEVTPYHDSGDKIATITVNGVPVDIYAKDLEVDTDYIAEQYDPDKAYTVGDYCMYNNKLYKCITAINASNWLKAPQTIGTFAVTVNSENTDDTYFTQTKRGKWMVISETTGQTINLNGIVNLTTAYSSGNYYYNSYDYYYPALLPYFNGGYANENEALTDFSNHSSFDPAKWTEVTVTDEISSALELPEVSAADNDKILKVINGSWGAATPDAGGRVIFEAVWNMSANTYTLQNATTYDIRDAVLAGKDIALRVTSSPLLGSWIYNLMDAGYNNNVISHATFTRTEPGTVSDGTKYITSAELKASFASDTTTLTYEGSTVDDINREVYSVSDEIDTGKRWYNGGKIFKKTYKARVVSMDGSTLNGVTVKLDDWNWKHTLINYECVGSQYFGQGRQQYGSYPISSNDYICSVFVQDNNGGGHASVTSPVELKAQIYGSTYASVIVTVYYVKTAFECSCEYSSMIEHTSGKVSIAGASLGARLVIMGNNGIVILSGIPARFKKVRVMVGPDTYDCIGGQYPSSMTVFVGLYYNHPEAGWVEIEPASSHELDLSSKAAMAAGTLIDFTNSANADLLKQYDTCLAFQIGTNYTGEELNPSFYPLTIDVEEWSEFDRS